MKFISQANYLLKHFNGDKLTINIAAAYSPPKKSQPFNYE